MPIYREDEVRAIRDMYATGEYTMQVLADQWDTSAGSISDIVNRKKWKYVA